MDKFFEFHANNPPANARYGSSRPYHALRSQDKDAMAMYAQLDIRESDGLFNADTPFFNCSISFS